MRRSLIVGIAALIGISANADGPTLLSIGSVPGYSGIPVNVPVHVVRATNIVAAQFDVAFDQARVSSGPAIGDLALNGHTVLSREIAPGIRRVLVYSRENAPLTNRTPVLLPFAVSAGEHNGSGPLTPLNAILATGDAAAVQPLELSGGTVFTRPVNRLADGHVQFFLPSTPDQRYHIQASGDLESWVTISTNIATGTYLDLVDVDAASHPYRFYRWQTAEE